jgi:hypothetical protein
VVLRGAASLKLSRPSQKGPSLVLSLANQQPARLQVSLLLVGLRRVPSVETAHFERSFSSGLGPVVRRLLAFACWVSPAPGYSLNHINSPCVPFILIKITINRLVQCLKLQNDSLYLLVWLGGVASGEERQSRALWCNITVWQSWNTIWVITETSQRHRGARERPLPAGAAGAPRPGGRGGRRAPTVGSAPRGEAAAGQAGV